MVEVWLVFIRKLALVSHICSLEVAPCVVKEKSTILTGCTAGGLPKTALQASGFEDTEGSVTLNAMDLVNLRRPGRWLRLSHMKPPGSGLSFLICPSCFRLFLCHSSGNVLGAPELPSP